MYLKTIAIAVSAFSVTGCISVNSYVDPQYSDLSFANVSIPQGSAYNVTTQMLTNGEPNSRGSRYLETAVASLMERAGISNIPEGTSLSITCNNIADMGEAAASGFGTGLTFGLAGSTITDGYEFTFVLSQDGEEETIVYRHVMQTTIGNAAAPIANVEAVTPQAGFDAILEDVFLKFLADQSENDAMVWLSSDMAMAG